MRSGSDFARKLGLCEEVNWLWPWGRAAFSNTSNSKGG
jgi:hypothetical protein